MTRGTAEPHRPALPDEIEGMTATQLYAFTIGPDQVIR